MSRGYGIVVEPGGEIIAGPQLEIEQIIYAELDHAKITKHRHIFDPIGHYARPDVFHLSVNTTPRSSVTFSDSVL